MRISAPSTDTETAIDEIDVLIVDDHRTFGDAMCIAVNLQSGLRCRGALTSAEAALTSIQDHGCPDVILLDVELPGMDGVTAIGAFRALCNRVRVILITADTSAQTLIDAVEAGADGFLPKGFPFTRVLQAIRGVDDGVVAEPLTLGRTIEHLRETADEEHPVGPVLDLTQREHEILILLAEGLPVKQVARQLHLSVNTCRGHVAAVLRKFDVHSQLAAVVQAARMGLLPNLRTGPQD